MRKSKSLGLHALHASRDRWTDDVITAVKLDKEENMPRFVISAHKHGTITDIAVLSKVII
jgi:hypothetical protein